MSTLSLRALRTLFALALAAVALAIWLAPMAGADPRAKAMFGAFVMAAALFSAPLAQYIEVEPVKRR